MRAYRYRNLVVASGKRLTYVRIPLSSLRHGQIVLVKGRYKEGK